MRVKVDRELCIGLGNCVAVAPAVFSLDGENRAVAGDPSKVAAQKLFEAAESCPQNAIIVEDGEGNQVYP